MLPLPSALTFLSTSPTLLPLLVLFLLTAELESSFSVPKLCSFYFFFGEIIPPWHPCALSPPPGEDHLKYGSSGKPILIISLLLTVLSFF